ncbi:MAG TPA: HNH endonuclease [Planctomycetaceae bacterium]|nr:HNH endonuclease [Planctomycetaceae bacterium]
MECLYCGKPATKKGEHVIPDRLAGGLTIRAQCPTRNVCRTCNNGVLSELDKELCVRFPLSFVAAPILGLKESQFWDIDRSDGNLLIEAHPNVAKATYTVCPQIIFETNQATVRGDYQQMLSFGPEAFLNILMRAAFQAFRRYEAGEKGSIHFERITIDSAIHDGRRYPPRLFTRSTITELAFKLVARKRPSFILRFATDVDRRHALNHLDKFTPYPKLQRFEQHSGSSNQAFRCRADMGMVLRALLKIAINTLAAFCSKTRVDHVTFKETIDLILGKKPIKREHFASNGFCSPDEIKSMAAQDNAHSLRLQHDDGVWHVAFSFFGGLMGGSVHFVGPNEEDWSRAEIVAPLNSNSWSVSTSQVLIPSQHRINWNDLRVIAPSLGASEISSRMTATPLKASR